uniref:Uncharacterized protein n=1 Tax=Chromera velia CCMP2878 TaxID=1169474 RepID=A0A0G4F4P6_9ALVE|eukprot:Cvel_15024.t1-p1 / transcript=Cvel_15024.t1 / gene=Cvel_15024 / organism=Chromera_velia_CCMP2878 / gene_product=Hemolytic phospholipase C, putative / transcript_product=Hemolytic phospholipase C, putative / location=Cvel_scaffold1093:36762-38420(+) / protein_length=553 / sequence_SO=supercontig / SO=protein_coding / is_pseudo=false
MLRPFHFLPAVLVSVLCTAKPAVDHVVVLVMENRPFDHFFGFSQSELPGIDGLNGDEFCYYDVKDPDQGREFVGKGKARYVCNLGPSQDFSVWCGDFFGPNVTDCSHGPYPPQDKSGFLQMNLKNPEVMWSFSPDQLPIKTALAKEFAIFDKWHSSFPGPSTPNHLFLQMGTAAGCTNTDEAYQCHKGVPYPQKTIYEALEDHSLSWAVYYNDSAWNTFIDWFETPRGQRGMHTYDTFYHAASTGSLPNFSWIVPRQGRNSTSGDGSNDDHPCHDVALGERLLKDTYEALRSGPGWNRTLFIVTYDDAGGFYDHVDLPTEGVPPPDDIPSCSHKTSFDYLGARVPTLMASPLIPKGTIIKEPTGPSGTVARPTETSQYEHTSLLASLKELFGLPSFLTKRDAWAATFLDFLSLPEPRTDTPMHMPEPPPKTEGEAAMHSCVSDREALSRRHRRRAEHYARVHGVSSPVCSVRDEGTGVCQSDATASEVESWILQHESERRQRIIMRGEGEGRTERAGQKAAGQSERKINSGEVSSGRDGDTGAVGGFLSPSVA